MNKKIVVACFAATMLFLFLASGNTTETPAPVPSPSDRVLFAVDPVRVSCSPRPVALHVPRDNVIPKSRDGSKYCCQAVVGDIDLGMTLTHLMSKYLCQVASSRQHPMRVVQVGANTGDNANDHLVRFLKLNVAHGVLLEPVPWIFEALSLTYANHNSHIVLINAAMSDTVGKVSFTAPRKGAKGWAVQMGGIKLPPKSAKKVNKDKLYGSFEQIVVRSETFLSVLDTAGWKQEVPDVFVVDAEGYDAVIVNLVLDSVSRNFGVDSRIPLIQYEWKHLAEVEKAALKERLELLGYCVILVHYDAIATMSELQETNYTQCSASYSLRV